MREWEIENKNDKKVRKKNKSEKEIRDKKWKWWESER